MTDRELLGLLKRKPNQALQMLSRRYAPLAVSIAGRILPGRVQDAEEIAADVLLRIWQKQKELEPETLRGFVITGSCGGATRYRCLTTIRRLRSFWRIRC